MEFNSNNKYLKYIRDDVNNQKDAKKKKARIIVEEPAQFDNTIETHLTDLVSLNKAVNELFGSVFSDFAGSRVGFDQLGKIETVIYFRDNKPTNDGKIKSLIPAGDLNKAKKDSDPFKAIKALNALMSENTYILTDDTKEMLEELMTVNGNNYNWKKLATEKLQSTGYNKVIYKEVSGLDILKILKKIYGAKAPNGGNYSYKIDVINALPGNILLSVMRLNVDEANALGMKYGMAQTPSSINMMPYTK